MAKFKPERDDSINSKSVYNKLKYFFEKNPDKFCERIGKGPPCEYRWFAWKIISGVNYSQIPGLYKELLEEADKLDENEHDKLRQINLDLNRTFPDFSYFSGKKGTKGQEKLKRALRAYAMYNKEVGYTQSINFLMGFFLMVNGGNDEEAFWLFVAITKKNQNFHMIGNFEGGLEGFYADKFPLYHQFVYQFDKLFERKIPKLKMHFDSIGYPAPVWLQKWFMTLFLYSFPMKLCIRLWDNLLVQGLVYIFKFPLAIMEILQPTLLKCNFEEVNDILSNLRTCDDPDLQETITVLPSTEKIMMKARKIELEHEDLQALKKEYMQMASLNDPIRHIKTLPKIMEEEDIYDEVKRMHSQSMGEDDPLFEREESKSHGRKLERPNSANIETFKIGNYLQEDQDEIEIKGGCRYTRIRSTMKVRVNKQNSNLKSSSVLRKESGIHNTSKLPPIFTQKEQADINAGFLKNLSIETSFDGSSKPPSTHPQNPSHPPHPQTTTHRSHRSLKIIPSQPRSRALPHPDNTLLNLPTFNSFSQSLGRYSSVGYLQHAHTDREVIEELSEDGNESLDNFLLNDQFGHIKSRTSGGKIRRVETEVEKLRKYDKNRSQEMKREDRKIGSERSNLIDAISHSENDKLQESFQQANSDLFLESQRHGPIRIVDLDSLDCSDTSSSCMEDSNGNNNSGNKTHDTIKAAEFHSPHNSNFVNFN